MLLFLMNAPARANCAMDQDYYIKAVGNSVYVYEEYGDDYYGWETGGLICPTPGGMLRQDVASHAVVKLADFCFKSDDYTSAYVDECVPPGDYRYGLAVPWGCGDWEEGCSSPYYYVAYYGEIEVTTPVEGCILSDGDPGDTLFDGGVPWTDTGGSQMECGGGGDTDTGGDTDSDTDSAEHGDSNASSGCSIVAPGTDVSFPLFVLMLVVGLAAYSLSSRRNG
ncbi:MAG: hypothetical protein PHU25_10580 [Deltaproteobacteria bacterium]|nr:hypothetical protein [Deltaproteobacteria bacterium]